jgi:hypothetical protein
MTHARPITILVRPIGMIHTIEVVALDRASTMTIEISHRVTTILALMVVDVVATVVTVVIHWCRARAIPLEALVLPTIDRILDTVAVAAVVVVLDPQTTAVAVRHIKTVRHYRHLQVTIKARTLMHTMKATTAQATLRARHRTLHMRAISTPIQARVMKVATATTRNMDTALRILAALHHCQHRATPRALEHPTRHTPNLDLPTECAIHTQTHVRPSDLGHHLQRPTLHIPLLIAMVAVGTIRRR